jgi:D-alanyl-D-alanine dipeptidase
MQARYRFQIKNFSQAKVIQTEQKSYCLITETAAKQLAQIGYVIYII